jgi:hypothetical protein
MDVLNMAFTEDLVAAAMSVVATKWVVNPALENRVNSRKSQIGLKRRPLPSTAAKRLEALFCQIRQD